MSFAGSFEAIGISPGDSVPPPTLQPPPLYPNLSRCPLPLEDSEVNQYLVAIKQEFRTAMARTPHFLKAEDSNTSSAQRYSDKTHLRSSVSSNGSINGGWNVDWRFFPNELKLGMKVKKSKSHARKRSRKFNINDEEGGISDGGKEKSTKKRKQRKVTFEGEEKDNPAKLDKKLDRLESLEQSGESEQSGEETTEEVYEEEEEEEGTDYNLTYFDNGEDYEAGEEDALEDGPVF